ncbi:site-2 protease family protein [Persephonella sp.]
MNMKPIPLFKIFGIQINLDFSWFVIFFLVTFTLAEGFFPHFYPGYSFIVYWIVGAVSSILLFVSVLLHELSHSITALHFNIPVKNINLFIFGGVAMIEEEAPNPRVEFLVAVAGPLCSFTIGLFFLVLVYLYPVDDLLNGIINYLMYVNFALGLFNLVPAFPLDGGRILRAIIWSKKDILTATKISSFTGTVFAYFLIFAGIWSLIKGNFLNGIWYGLIGLFLKQASKISYEQTKLTVILSKYRVENFMQTLKPLLPDETVLDFMNFYFPFYRSSIYPVIGKDGQVYVLYIEDIKKIPQEKWAVTYVMDIAKPLVAFVSPYDSLYKAIKIMNRYNLNEIPVIYGNTILGIIRKSAVELLLEKFMEEEKK